MTTKPEIKNAVADQEWSLVADKGGTITRSGTTFAQKLQDIGCYENGFEVLVESKVGDVIKTGVSAYRRIR
jgi:hypothetical protein